MCVKTKSMKRIFLTSLLFTLAIQFSVLAQRKVLVEQFTNSGCPNCAGNTPVVADYVNDNPDEVLMLSYHVPFPYNDSMYHENSYQSDQRVDYYNVFSVPTSRVDGNYFSGNLVPVLSSTITNRAAIAPRYSISFNSSQLSDKMVSLNISFTSIDAGNAGQPLNAMVVVTEKNVLKSSYAASPGNNSESAYPWVVRRMLPDETGTVLLNTGLNETNEVSLTWTADNFKDLSQLRVVAFVQNTAIKEVYQAEISAPEISTGLATPAEKSDVLFDLFPNITTDNFTIRLYNSNEVTRVNIFDINGRIMYETNTENTSLIVNAGFMPAGVYVVQVSNSTATTSKRLIVSK